MAIKKGNIVYAVVDKRDSESIASFRFHPCHSLIFYSEVLAKNFITNDSQVVKKGKIIFE